MSGSSSLMLAALLGLASPPDAESPVESAIAIDPRVAFCDRSCPFEHTTQDRALCCGEEIITDPARLEGEALLYAQAIADARDEDDALKAARTFYRSMSQRAYALARSEGPEAGDECEQILREALALRLPASIDGHPLALAERERIPQIGRMLALAAVGIARSRTPRGRTIRSRDLPKTIQGLLQLAESYERLARWSSEADTAVEEHPSSAAQVLHQAFMIAAQFRRVDLVCPALLSTETTSPQLAFDVKICLGETDDRRALRLQLDQMSGVYRRDVTLWSRYLRVGHPIQSAAIATAALSVGAASSALFFNSRYLALCRMTTDELRCVGDEPEIATAARRASIGFGIAAPALLLTSGYLFVLRARERRYRRRRPCVPFVGGTASSAAASVTCRF